MAIHSFYCEFCEFCVSVLKRNICDHFSELTFTFFTLISRFLHRRLEEQTVVTRCELSTIETYEMRDLRFSSSDDVAKAIINSEWLQSAFSSVDPSASSLSILFSPSYKPAVNPSATGGDETIDTTIGGVNEDDSWMHDKTPRESKAARDAKKKTKKVKPVQMLRLSADGDFGSSVVSVNFLSSTVFLNPSGLVSILLDFSISVSSKAHFLVPLSPTRRRPLLSLPTSHPTPQIELPVDPAVVFEFACQYETENR